MSDFLVYEAPAHLLLRFAIYRMWLSGFPMLVEMSHVVRWKPSRYRAIATKLLPSIRSQKC